MTHPSVLSFVTYAFTGILFISAFGSILASKHLNKFEGICLYFSTVLTTTAFVAVVSHQLKAFDVHGDPHNFYGTLILNAVKTIIDFQSEAFLLLSILYLFVSPVLFTYVIFGLFGYASSINVIGPVLTIIVYSALKFIISAMAVMMILIPWGYWEGWFKDRMSSDITLFSEIISVNLIGISLLILILYLEARNIKKRLDLWAPKPLMRPLQLVHRWLSRKIDSGRTS